jgi:hypothetical protein
VLNQATNHTQSRWQQYNMNQEIILKRLSIVKLLYKIGMEQSYKGEMTSFFSILSFHDCIEMFLKLAVEKNNKKDCQNFMDYWEKLPKLTLKESMRNLNTNRVNLKHKGITPSKPDIETARVNTTSFFQQNTKTYFGIDFKDVSLFELIKYNNAKELLINASDKLDSKNFKECAIECTKAFNELLLEYKKSKSAEYSYKTPFDLVKTISSRDSGLNQDSVSTINENFKNLETTLQVISLGIDYKKYIKFNILTPEFYKSSQGIYQMRPNDEKKLTDLNCEFLIDFVLDSALILQDFDFEFSDVALDGKRMSIRMFK